MRLIGTLLVFATTACARAEPPSVVRAETEAFRVVQVATGLEHPWGLALLPDGRMLVTERPGRVRIVTADGKLGAPLAGTPQVFVGGQGGMLDVVLDPSFAENRLIYLSYSHGEGALTTTRVAQARLGETALEDLRVIFSAEPMVSSRNHFGSRLAFLRDGTLLVTVGDRFGERDRAQELDNHLGKVIRITTDGRAPADNPFVGRADARPEIWTYGHRNPQGLLVDPATGTAWEQEHGPRGGDEINRLRPGANYGWPVITYGEEYSGGKIGEGTAKEGMEQPDWVWVPSIAPSGMTLYDGGAFPSWRGDLLVGALAGQMLVRLDLDAEGRITGEERMLEGDLGRIRDVRTAQDGSVYLITDDDPGGIFRLEPLGD
jgi:glucose/arabinose dehydrogenase